MSLPETADRVEDIPKLKRRLNRERHTRIEAERIAEKGLRELYDKQQQFRLLEQIAVAANESSSLPGTLQLALSLVCEFTGWMLGHAYVCDAVDQATRLVSTDTWYGPTAERLHEFKRQSEEAHFTSGIGLPGRVLATGSAQWIKDIRVDDNFIRREAACAAGIRAACAFPVLVGSEVVAVVEFFSDQVIEPNELLLQLMSQIGTQMGRVVERTRAADQRVAAESIKFELDRRLLIDQAEDKLHKQNARLDAALANMPHGLCMFDAEKRLVVCNAPYAELYNLPTQLLVPGTPLEAIVDYRRQIGNAPADFANYVSHVGVEWKEEGNSVFEFSLQDGRIIRINHLALRGGGYVATHEDVTEAANSETRIRHMARHDPLTDLPNRTLFRERLEAALNNTSGDRLAVLCLDLDDFKGVNDSLGHPMGDALLVAVGDRLRECCSERDTIARLGGDEFAIVQEEANQPAAATALARRINEAVVRPFDLNGHHLVVGTSIGIAFAPEDGTDSDELLKNADMALYRAKSDGRGTHSFFEPAMDANIKARRQLEVGLRRALSSEEFELHYQPLVNLRENSITGFEALLRWRDPERGLIPPGEFIPLAEQTGLIVPIGDWVIKRACADAAKWPCNLPVAVNLSAAQFKDRHLTTVVFAALAASHLPASRLELEITETVLLKNSEATLAALHQLRDFGIRISMDDFGTGYSSLSYLRSFPFDKIKIDQGFVRDLGRSDDSLAIVRAVVGLAAALKMTTIAEGVETAEQLDCLRREGCTEVQGFLLGRPLSPSQLAEFFARPKWSDAIAA